ncbi:energy-coupling factor ABC transporter permease [Mahella australiensis]|uniref:Cobalamin (Vitamin B12) biosynthesis CbiM protein n=1 Tax=Mahella australiensis (strain DSM 15567 / CIP 107919 / 50-1 BON) TaxID=697281 RepID=F4A1R9_MAHA5|nr:energy-coupling factor ABC transporter permease [Mahella australiensis]AEE97119.1 cobalamin (vitamin B12) biosynthesis CbiM protein [Mahella australiensis 50-1 BON]
MRYSKLPFCYHLREGDTYMHIPDGFLDTKTMIASATVSVAVIAISNRNIKRAFDEQPVPSMGMMAAFVFVAQMLNFPIAPGVSGHLLGSALVTALFGPAAGMIIMTAVVALQALLFHDGGIMALGANVLNMAVLGCWVAYAVQRIPFGGKIKPVSLFASGWLSIELAAFAASVELGVSATVPFDAVVWPMLLWHAIIGIIEGIITAVTVPFLAKVTVLKPWRKQEVEE